jgi:hypothetical protein
MEFAAQPAGQEIPVALMVCSSLATEGAVFEPGAKKLLAVKVGSLVAEPLVAEHTTSSASVKVPPAELVKYEI